MSTPRQSPLTRVSVRGSIESAMSPALDDLRPAQTGARGGEAPPEAAERTRRARAGTSGYLPHPRVASSAYARGLAHVMFPDGTLHVLDLVGICGAQAALELARVELSS